MMESQRERVLYYPLLAHRSDVRPKIMAIGELLHVIRDLAAHSIVDDWVFRQTLIYAQSVRVVCGYGTAARVNDWFEVGLRTLFDVTVINRWILPVLILMTWSTWWDVLASHQHS